VSAKINDLVYEIEESERKRQPEKDQTRPATVAEMMLAVNAKGHLDAHIKSNVTFSPDSHPLERIGSTVIDSILFLLQGLDCPSEHRDIVLCICGLSGGEYKEYTKITQKQIAERMGLTTRTVRDKIGALRDWMMFRRRAIIQIKEREINSETGQYDITEYRPIILNAACEYLRICKQRGLPPINRQRALEGKLEDAYDEVADAVIDNIPDAPYIGREKKEKNVTPSQQKASFIESKVIRILRDVDEWADSLISSQYDVADYAPELVSQVYDRITAKAKDARKKKAIILGINQRIKEKAEGP
jgi:hypothetical protein